MYRHVQVLGLAPKNEQPVLSPAGISGAPATISRGKEQREAEKRANRLSGPATLEAVFTTTVDCSLLGRPAMPMPMSGMPEMGREHGTVGS